MQGRFTFKAPRERVWDLLMDPQVLARCMPGCQALTAIGPDRYSVLLKIGVAAVKGEYRGTITLLDKEPPLRYRLRVEGEGRGGFIRGEGAFSLTEKEGTTTVLLEGEAQVGGTIATVGQRLLGGVASLLLRNFFTCLGKNLG